MFSSGWITRPVPLCQEVSEQSLLAVKAWWGISRCLNIHVAKNRQTCVRICTPKCWPESHLLPINNSKCLTLSLSLSLPLIPPTYPFFSAACLFSFLCPHLHMGPFSFHVETVFRDDREAFFCQFAKFHFLFLCNAERFFFFEPRCRAENALPLQIFTKWTFSLVERIVITP